MFPLLRHIGQSSRYQIPPRPIVLREHIDAVATGLQKLVAAAWRCVDTVLEPAILLRSESLAGPRTPRPRRRIAPST
jgi:hypothetical protein